MDTPFNRAEQFHLPGASYFLEGDWSLCPELRGVPSPFLWADIASLAENAIQMVYGTLTWIQTCTESLSDKYIVILNASVYVCSLLLQLLQEVYLYCW